ISCACGPIICSCAPVRRPATVAAACFLTIRALVARAAAPSFSRSFESTLKVENCGQPAQFRAVKCLDGKQKPPPPQGRIDSLQQWIRRDKCVRKIDLDQIHEAPLLIDSAAGAPRTTVPRPPGKR